MGAHSSTFLIVDLSGYSALTEIHGDRRAADAATTLYSATRRLVDLYGSEELKTLGDAVLLRSDRAVDALSLAARLVTDVGRTDGELGVRAGLDTGPAIERGGEWFGSVLNRAARIVDVAEPGTVLLTAATLAEAEKEGSAAQFKPAGSPALKNLREAVEVYSMTLEERSPGLVLDPVCRMLIDPAKAPFSRAEPSDTIYFCSQACVAAYDADAPRR